jgi:hypothetical protein
VNDFIENTEVQHEGVHRLYGLLERTEEPATFKGMEGKVMKEIEKRLDSGLRNCVLAKTGALEGLFPSQDKRNTILVRLLADALSGSGGESAQQKRLDKVESLVKECVAFLLGRPVCNFGAPANSAGGTGMGRSTSESRGLEAQMDDLKISPSMSRARSLGAPHTDEKPRPKTGRSASPANRQQREK